ncbi:MAG: hypothetical protein KAU48_13950, partial [Candidatus Thorarchaeota archaeon]|nr:hypothetical protein [Candidatus Thorarchaeota archaeon]
MFEKGNILFFGAHRVFGMVRRVSFLTNNLCIITPYNGDETFGTKDAWYHFEYIPLHFPEQP